MRKYKNILEIFVFGLILICGLGLNSAYAQTLVPDTVTTKSSVDSIKTLQSALNVALKSQAKTPLVVNGIWTTKTTNAVKLFQSWSGLNPTGKVDLATSTNLNISLLTSE